MLMETMPGAIIFSTSVSQERPITIQDHFRISWG